jgi:uncharacterized protein YlxW (UPF0749 family)
MDLSEDELGSIINQLTLENDNLRKEIVDLKIKLINYQRQQEDQSSILNQSLQDLQTLKVLGCLTEVEGRGLEVNIVDSESLLRPFDFLEIIHELKSAEAEAIAINGVRLSPFSSVSQESGSLVVEGKKITAPYKIEAIGDPELLKEALTITGGVVDTLSTLEGVGITVTEAGQLILPPTQQPLFKYATFEEE